MPLTLDSVIFRNEIKFLANPMGDEIVILNMESGDYLGLNSVGAAIWEHIKEPNSVQQLIEKLMSEYEVDENTCKAQTLEYLERIANIGLLEVRN